MIFQSSKISALRAGTSSVSIANPMETGIGRNTPHWISYRNKTHDWTPNQIFHNFEKSQLSKE